MLKEALKVFKQALNALAAYPPRNLLNVFLAVCVAGGGSFVAVGIDRPWGAIIGGLLMITAGVAGNRLEGFDMVTGVVLAVAGLALMLAGVLL